MNWDEHHTLCKNGDLAVLVSHLAQENDLIERECFYFGTFNMTYRNHPQVAITIGRLYIEEYYKTAEPFGSGHLPNGDILKQLVLLFDPFQYEEDEDYQGDPELAVWVCKFALAFGVSDGTKKGFQGRLEAFEKSSATDSLPPANVGERSGDERTSGLYPVTS